MSYTVYNPDNGQVLYNIFGNNPAVNDHISNKSYIDGYYNDQEHYIDTTTKQVIEKGSKPSNNHDWNITTKTWELNNDKITTSIRSERNGLLSDIDRVNPVWFSSLTTEQQQELQAYRVALLNVPQQSGFPNSVTWPTKPSWL
jgi:hypothetical protein